MFRPRVMPVLLLRGKGLVKTVRFKDPRYLGDPINAVRIFNEKETDELLFLDITASKENRSPFFDVIRQIGDECFMPFAVGGGIRNVKTIRELLSAGAEKVCINSFAVEKPEFIREAAGIFGNQSIVVSLDVRRKMFGKPEVYIYGGTKATGHEPVELARQMEEMGAGEILINSINRDGTGEGYDLDLVKAVSQAVNIPVIACGGAGELIHFSSAIFEGEASAVAAGSKFVFHGKRRAVLINYPTKDELNNIFEPGNQ